MAYRNPIFAFLHAGQLAGASSITSNLSIDADFPLSLLVDGRQGALCKLAAAATSAWTLDLDRGSGTLEVINRMLIPAGHNFNSGSGTLKLEADDTSGFTSPTTLVAAFVPDAGLIDKSFSNNNERYVRLTRSDESYTWQLGEWYLTRDRQPSLGWEPDWRDEYVDNIINFITKAGVSASETQGSARRLIEFEVSDLDGTDLAIYDELASVVGYGPGRPFYFYSSDDTEAAVFMELSGRIQRVQNRRVPKAGVSYLLRVSMIEALG